MDIINTLLLLLILAIVSVLLIIELKRAGQAGQQVVQEAQAVGSEMITSAHTIIANLLAKIPNHSSTAAPVAAAPVAEPQAPAPQVVVIPKP